MSIFKSKINTNSEGFRKNREDMMEHIQKLRELNSRGATISEKRRPRFEARGQLTPRERLARLLDPGMPFMSIGNIAGYLLDTDDPDKSVPGSTVMSGIGFIGGVRCIIVVDDSGIQAGSLTVAGGYRITRAEEIALEQQLPLVHLVESAGGDLIKYTVESFSNGGFLFGNLAKLSKAGIPVISILHGSSTAGGAYMPGLSDYVIAVKGNGRAFLAGPPLLKAATGEIANEEELGGAEMHANISGLTDYLAENDGQAVQMCRELIHRLRWNKSCNAPNRGHYLEPLYDPDEIAGVIPCDYRTPYDMRELVARIVDGSDFMDFKSRYGSATVCLQAEIFGLPVGIIGNNGPIDPDGANKATQFLQLCDQSDIPMVFLQNTTGYIVGTKSEQAGMIKHGAKMIQAVRNLEVPRITLMTGASFGAGNYGMCGRGYEPDFLYTFPQARMGVMGGEQAAKTMSMVARGKAEAAGQDVDENVIAQQEAYLANLFDSQSSAYYTSGHMLDDGMIDPRDSRKTLGFLLETVWEKRNRTVRENSFGIARV
ncbi:putative carboxyl transferase domain protein [marine gamma proteobacterium HTCC2148]|jgi:geranyl-CoA carboxylase beta subunit|uniref:Acyl-CoA carboxylase subunit beta n=1 Tax=Candidatus Seongchinamella marina TaxID=2518990 RepID=A0ABT3SS57_9GAMM|nr:carboxyl transferase domain-containing protein [Candidatus Seongchinamella marina]EEB77343.1 putative carboxyl transferase domain protein [marine gamma proteobacterium HTCC2148]MCX2972816.1 acyl-CoA carboxylase subunit beta [Candidatus Seongchinamella marina]